MHRSAWLLVGSVLILACNDDDEVLEPPPPPPAEFQWEATLEGQEGWEQLSGETAVLFIDEETSFTATTQMAGDEPGAIRPWHVHLNSCQEGGGIVGDDADYARLEIGENGTAEAAATVPQTLDPEVDYHVNVHLSEEEMGTIVMCGDLELQL